MVTYNENRIEAINKVKTITSLSKSHLNFKVRAMCLRGVFPSWKLSEDSFESKFSNPHRGSVKIKQFVNVCIT